MTICPRHICINYNRGRKQGDLFKGILHYDVAKKLLYITYIILPLLSERPFKGSISQLCGQNVYEYYIYIYTHTHFVLRTAVGGLWRKPFFSSSYCADRALSPSRSTNSRYTVIVIVITFPFVELLGFLYRRYVDDSIIHTHTRHNIQHPRVLQQSITLIIRVYASLRRDAFIVQLL